MNKDDLNQLLRSCIDVKGQQVVSLTRLAEELGVKPLTKEDIKVIVESKKFCKENNHD